MTKQDMLELIKLLSALESLSFSNGARLPDYLFERLEQAIEKMTDHVLKDEQ